MTKRRNATHQPITVHSAVQKEERGVHPNEPRQMQRDPAVAAGAQIDEGAGHGHEEHHDGDDDDDDGRGVAAR